MSFCERFILKDVQGFQNLTADEKQKDLTLFKHKYLAVWLTCFFMHSMIPNLLGFVICVVNLVVNFFVDGAGVLILFCITMPIAIALLSIDTIIFYKYKRKKQTTEEVGDWFIEKFQNLWLLNWKVISFKDWKIIKKRYNKLYIKARSEVCNHKCYDTTYAIANTLQNPDIKILWICIESRGHKCGHAVISRNDEIYDSNLRRTFNREEYLKAFNAEIFKEYSLEEYSDKENLPQSCFVYLDWEQFGEWCVEHNAVRSN